MSAIGVSSISNACQRTSAPLSIDWSNNMATASCLYRRPRHRAVATLLAALSADKLRAMHCYFEGGTAIALQVDEFRESADVDFLCSDQIGYRQLREVIFESDIDSLFLSPIRKLRETRADRDGVRNFLEVDGIPVKFEIIAEGRIQLTPSTETICGVTSLCHEDLYAEKLLANADRGLDTSTYSRDAIDLLALISSQGAIPLTAWTKATQAYGHAAESGWRKVCALLRDDAAYWNSAMTRLAIDALWGARLRSVLEAQ
ncbi:MAG: nucleotidyl transferase AbiEii/AbiGii toxin family protein [Betaproteobacteria bacterium]|nr:nucleotidyl transferase AbiEii/AbiGii toxin family protein [Betaproteobacteria bacterium]